MINHHVISVPDDVKFNKPFLTFTGLYLSFTNAERAPACKVSGQ